MTELREGKQEDTLDAMGNVKLSPELKARVKAYKDSRDVHRDHGEQLKKEKRRLCQLLMDCGVPVDQVARCLGVKYRNYVYAILSGER